MKNLLMLISMIAFVSCSEPETTNENATCFQVSFVTGICGEAVLKIENPTFFKYGETWNGYTHVFFTVFECSVDEPKVSNEKFFVEIKNESPSFNTSCVRCFATLDYKGTQKHLVKIVSECNDSSPE